jgi:hypothetical protein
MAEQTFTDGLTVRELVAVLLKFPQNQKFKIACEEQNTVYNGFYIGNYSNEIVITGLSGTEDER